MYLDTHDRPSGHVIHHLADALSARARRIAHRRELKKLLDLDDYLLTDVGLSREDVERAMGMPLSADIANEVYRKSLTRP